MDFSKNTYNPYTLKKRVFDLENGWGIVTQDRKKGTYPITVLFESGETQEYDYNGKRYEHGNQMLYTYKPTIV